MKLRLLLVRHAVTSWNREGRIQGQSDVPLEAEGIEQIKRLAARLDPEPISAIYSSDLFRAKQSAELIAKSHNLPILLTPLLREAHFGLWEGLTETDLMQAGRQDELRRYARDPYRNRPPGGEKVRAIWSRLNAVRRLIMETHKEGTVLVVGHGSSLRVFLAWAAGGPARSIFAWHLGNASLSIIEISPNPRIVLVNDTSHLK